MKSQRSGITAVVCTRNRGNAVVAAVQSILKNDLEQFSLVVVDQSTNDVSRLALEALPEFGRIKYVATDTVGLARARNVGLAHAETDRVAFTDDDCEVPPDWIRTIDEVFSEHPRVAVLFCSVRAGPHDSKAGFIPAYECRGTRILHSIFEKPTARGIGAGLAVRRQAMEEIGGFDEFLGAGAEFPSCEDGDAAVRALLAGWEVCETDRTHVLHHGFRTWQEGRELSRRDWVGIGAAYAKPLRAWRWQFVPVPLYEFVVKALWPPIDDVFHLRRPRGVARTAHFIRGFSLGMTAPFDPHHLVFRPPPKD